MRDDGMSLRQSISRRKASIHKEPGIWSHSVGEKTMKWKTTKEKTTENPKVEDNGRHKDVYKSQRAWCMVTRFLRQIHPFLTKAHHFVIDYPGSRSCEESNKFVSAKFLRELNLKSKIFQGSVCSIQLPCERTGNDTTFLYHPGSPILMAITKYVFLSIIISLVVLSVLPSTSEKSQVLGSVCDKQKRLLHEHEWQAGRETWHSISTTTLTL